MCPLTKPNSVVQSFYCNLRNIDWHKNMKFNFHFNLTRPVNDLWMHFVVYYKFNGLVYQKFPIDLWENFCEWQASRLTGRPTAMYMLDWTLGKVVHKSNLNHPCPLVGYYVVQSKNTSMDTFIVEPLLPSGRYRLDVYVTENDRVPVCEGHLYFSISDYRLEKI